jgi:geranylgeranyl reductase family protein
MRGLNEIQQVDVIVLGLGPAGASAAAAAAKAGLTVIALDRKKVAGLPVQCAEFVPTMIGQTVPGFADSRRQLITHMVTYIEGDDETVTENFPGNMICRSSFDQLLVEQAILAGAQCRFGVKVRNIDKRGTVRTDDGVLWSAKIIIGADGPHSLAGEAIGKRNVDCVETRQITVPLLQSHSATDIFLSADIPGGYGWLFPSGSKANLGLGLAPQWRKDLKPLLDELHRQMVLSGRLSAQVEKHTGGAIPVGGMITPYGTLADTTVLLAGDAAGLTNPITGAGINAAVTSGAMAGRAAAAIVAGDTNAAVGYGEDLDDIFGASLRRALRRRKELMGRFALGHKPGQADLRSSWIAFPEYWAA